MNSINKHVVLPGQQSFFLELFHFKTLSLFLSEVNPFFILTCHGVLLYSIRIFNFSTSMSPKFVVGTNTFQLKLI
jgi:hypothetical protein